MEKKKSIHCLNENRSMEGFVSETGIYITEIKAGYARGYFGAQHRHSNPNGSIHGGMIFTLADTVAGAAAESQGRMVTTMNASVNFLKPAFEGNILSAEAKIRKDGKNVCVYDVDICNEKEELIVTATLTFFYLS